MVSSATLEVDLLVALAPCWAVSREGWWEAQRRPKSPGRQGWAAVPLRFRARPGRTHRRAETCSLESNQSPSLPSPTPPHSPLLTPLTWAEAR